MSGLLAGRRRSGARRRRKSYAPLLAAAVLAAASALAPVAAAAQTLHGRVVVSASGDAVSGAVVRLLDADERAHASATADAEGRFSITAAAAGDYRIGVEAVGYAPSILGPVSLTAAAPVSVLIRVAPDAVPLEPLRVEAAGRVAALERDGFYDRRRLGHGRFFERDDIETRNPRRVVDMLRTVAGVRVIESGNSADILLRAGGAMGMRAGPSACAPEIYLDGRLIARGGEPGRDRYNLNEIRPAELEAIEIYASAAQVPARFGGAHSACGVVLFWSRR